MLDKLIYFLREIQDRYFLFIICILSGLLYLHVGDDFTSQLLNTVMSALLGLLIGRPRGETKTETNINTETIETPSINNEEMNNATINVTKNNSNKKLKK